MFAGARSFSGDISDWDVSRVTDMKGMFDNDALDIDMSDVTFNSADRGTSVVNGFYDAKITGQRLFNGDISKWDVSRVTDMNIMFASATSFNGDISKWDVSRVTDMSYMFQGATSFNSDISKWDVSRVDNMRHMFKAASAFSHTLCGTWQSYPPIWGKFDVLSSDSPGQLCSEAPAALMMIIQIAFTTRCWSSFGLRGFAFGYWLSRVCLSGLCGFVWAQTLTDLCWVLACTRLLLGLLALHLFGVQLSHSCCLEYSAACAFFCLAVCMDCFWNYSGFKHVFEQD